METIDPIPSEPKLELFKPVVCLLRLADGTSKRVVSDRRVLDKQNTLVEWQGNLFSYTGTNEDSKEGWVRLYREVSVVKL